MFKRKILLSSLVFTLTLAFLLFIPPLSAHAAVPTIDLTKVTGQIKDSNNQPFKFARIVAVCDGKSLYGLTNSQGQFTVMFVGKDSCKEGSTVTVTANQDGKTGVGSGIVQLLRDGRVVDVNFSILGNNAVGVPEFGVSTGVIAAFFALGTYLVIRKKINKLVPVNG